MNAGSQTGGGKAAWIAVLLFAATLRFAAMAAFSAYERGSETAHHEHASIAANLVEGRGFRFNFFGPLNEPVLTSQQAPLVPFLLAGCYAMLGTETPAAFALMLTLQILVSSATVMLLGLAATRIAGKASVGLTTAVLAAVYPPLIVSPLHIQALVWNLFWLAGLLLGTAMIRQGDRRTGGALFIASAAGGLHTDPILAAPMGLLWLLLIWDAYRGVASPRRRTRQSSATETGEERSDVRRLREGSKVWRLRLREGEAQSRLLQTVTIIAFCVAVSLVPWTVRNYQVHGRLMLVKDSFPYVFWQGNNPASQGTDKLLVADANARQLANVLDPSQASRLAFEVRGQAVSVDSTLSEEFIRELQSLPSEIERMDRFAELTKQNWSPTVYLRLCGRRLTYLLWFDATNPRSYLWHYRMGYFALVVLAASALLPMRNHAMTDVAGRWAPVFIVAVSLVCVHALVITSARFRIPLEMLLVFPAAFGALNLAVASSSRLRDVMVFRLKVKPAR